MQLRFVKDFAIALIAIFLLAYAVRLYGINVKRTSIPDKSKYSNESVSDTLKTKILSIESSIQDRQNFVFSISHDPLKQGNIIKDRFDLTKEFQDMVRNTFRPTGTYIDVETGKRLVTVEYLDRIYSGGVGDVIEGRKITSISEKSISIYYGGAQTLIIQKRPDMPDFNKDETQKQSIDLNY